MYLFESVINNHEYNREFLQLTTNPCLLINSVTLLKLSKGLLRHIPKKINYCQTEIDCPVKRKSKDPLILTYSEYMYAYAYIYIIKLS